MGASSMADITLDDLRHDAEPLPLLDEGAAGSGAVLGGGGAASYLLGAQLGAIGLDASFTGLMALAAAWGRRWCC